MNWPAANTTKHCHNMWGLKRELMCTDMCQLLISVILVQDQLFGKGVRVIVLRLQSAPGVKWRIGSLLWNTWEGV